MKKQSLDAHSAIYRFRSIEPAKKIYGRLDFLKGFNTPKSHKPSPDGVPRRNLLSRSSSINRQTMHKDQQATQMRRTSRINLSHASDNKLNSSKELTKLQLPTTSKNRQGISSSQLRTSLQQKNLEKTKELLRGFQPKSRGPQATQSYLSRTIDISRSQSQNSANPQATIRSKLIKKSFQYHNPQQCLCHECTCGRHMCKFHTITPSIHFDSLYHKQYSRRAPLPNLAFKPATESLKPPIPTVSHDSTYLKDYRQSPDSKKGQLQRPQDHLGFKGPSVQHSMYSCEYIGHHGDNQYVKPTDKHYLQGLGFKAQSVYQKCYLPKLASPQKLHSNPKDNLSQLGLWLGHSSYRDNFKNPGDCTYQSPRQKLIQKRIVQPDDVRGHYQSIYRNEFMKKQPTVCRAKVLLESSLKGSFQNSKTKLNANSDYKAASPSFHAIATSKFCYN